jgi:hypothetical protein
MTRSTLLALALSLALAAPAAAATSRPKARPSLKPTAVRASSPRPSAKDSTATPRARPKAARTLDDIHIEGEIPVPQVLFITARDQRRFLEFQQRRYLETSLEIGEHTAFPNRIVVPRAASLKPKEKTP